MGGDLSEGQNGTAEIQNDSEDKGHGRRSFDRARLRKKIEIRMGIEMRIGSRRGSRMVHPNTLQRIEKVGLTGTFRLTSKQKEAEWG
ncbi:hypothetical protein U1Q18_015834 [Sarracenia purpurea var. burkii]